MFDGSHLSLPNNAATFIAAFHGEQVCLKFDHLQLFFAEKKWG